MLDTDQESQGLPQPARDQAAFALGTHVDDGESVAHGPGQHERAAGGVPGDHLEALTAGQSHGFDRTVRDASDVEVELHQQILDPLSLLDPS
jgi:hypothetical protein